MLKTNAWNLLKENEKEQIFLFAEEYKNFISENKTERRVLNNSVEIAKKSGFMDISTMNKVSPGNKIFKINKNKQVIFGKI